ncbi:hypothetical protein MHB71_05095 [Paenibacillus sp. FSL H7-0940]|uniref:hypothetical protein n=1 Tax=Paenibacillus sp. FSL H7-0940 TaxID=2921443 RepID=UPI0030ECB0C8
MLHRGLDGKEIPSGKIHKQLCANFLDGALPSWLTTVGTPTFEPPPGRGLLRLTTAATAASSVELKSTATFNSTQFTEISYTIEGLQFNGNIQISAQIGIKSADSKAGITFFHNVNQPSGIIRAYKADGTYTDYPTKMAFFTVNMAGDEGQNSKNLTVRLFTGKQYAASTGRRVYVYVQNDDQVGALADVTDSFIDGDLQCIAKLTTSAAVAKTLVASQVKIDLWSN